MYYKVYLFVGVVLFFLNNIFIDGRRLKQDSITKSMTKHIKNKEKSESLI